MEKYFDNATLINNISPDATLVNRMKLSRNCFIITTFMLGVTSLILYLKLNEIDSKLSNTNL